MEQKKKFGSYVKPMMPIMTVTFIIKFTGAVEYYGSA